MSNDKYILAADGETPIPEPELVKWAAWFESAERHVAQDSLADGLRVSTVFLGLDHNFGFGSERVPILWETMIFGADGDLEDYQERYKSYADAVAGHAVALDLAKKWLAGKQTPA